MELLKSLARRRRKNKEAFISDWNWQHGRGFYPNGKERGQEMCMEDWNDNEMCLLRMYSFFLFVRYLYLFSSQLYRHGRYKNLMFGLVISYSHLSGLFWQRWKTTMASHAQKAERRLLCIFNWEQMGVYLWVGGGHYFLHQFLCNSWSFSLIFPLSYPPTSWLSKWWYIYSFSSWTIFIIKCGAWTIVIFFILRVRDTTFLSSLMSQIPHTHGLTQSIDWYHICRECIQSA